MTGTQTIFNRCHLSVSLTLKNGQYTQILNTRSTHQSNVSGPSHVAQVRPYLHCSRLSSEDNWGRDQQGVTLLEHHRDDRWVPSSILLATIPLWLMQEWGEHMVFWFHLLTAVRLAPIDLEVCWWQAMGYCMCGWVGDTGVASYLFLIEESIPEVQWQTTKYLRTTSSRCTYTYKS